MKKNILIVTLHCLDGVGGGVFASRAFINAFAEIFANEGSVTLLYPASEKHGIDGIDKRINAIPIYDNAPKWKKFYNLTRGLVHRNFRAIPDILSKEHFDIVVFDNSRVSFKMIDLAHKSGAKVITIHHNCELEYNRDNCNSILKPVIMFWTKHYEREAVVKSDLNLTLTNDDKYLLIEKYCNNSTKNNQIQVLGTFESSHCEYEKSEGTIKEPKHFIITGNLSAKQTVDSIIPWLNSYYPILKQEIPEASLTLAGKNPPKQLRDKCKELGVEIIPSPKDMASLLEKADCYICPTALGGGLKLRIMDGLKTGLPVISHKVSVRGYEDFVDKGLMFAYSDEQTFKQACIDIKMKIFEKSRTQKLYEEIFSYDNGIQRLNHILLQESNLLSK